ncbi:recombination directionality factor [Streptomyces sp. NPDC000851]
MLDIFATDPEAKAQREEREAAKERATRPDYAFQFRSGKMNGRQPVSFRKWRITTPKLEVANALKELYGGTIGEAPNGDYAVDTDTESIEVIVNASKIESKLIQWADGLPVHECDGSVFLSPDEDKGKPCGCPKILAERKDKAKQRRGPKPNITIPVRLPQDEDLGLGKYTATAWSFAEDLPYTMQALSKIDGEALCVLRLEHVEYTTQSGEKREFTKPVLDVVKAFADAIADDPED